MNLIELRWEFQSLFYSQDWFWGEAFMERESVGTIVSPTGIAYVGMPPETLGVPIALEQFVPAVDLAMAYVADPKNDIWNNYFWTSDFDNQGQRVYLGNNGQGLELHRYLHITERFGLPLW